MLRDAAKVALVVNPAAQNGQGAQAAAVTSSRLREALGGDGLEVWMTEAPLQGISLARGAAGYDVLIALGGDGLVHEVANGLMAIPAPARPVLGVVPVGSGNDYARTLGMALSLDKALGQLLCAQVRPMDVGCCNGEYFVETLSFGLDAAIALDTAQRRVRTGHTGTRLFMESGIDKLFNDLRTYRYCARFDGGGRITADMFLFAVQIGPTYGGGFKICPDAQPDDGLFDICIASPPLSVAKAALIFLLAKNARHTSFKQIGLRQAQTVHLEFEEQPPAQVDGEQIVASHFDISLVPNALSVLVP